MRQTFRASEIVNNLLNFSRTSGTEFADVDINKVIIETVALARGEILRNHVSLATRLASDLPPIRGDRVQLQQVIMNLVMNAVEAMSSVDGGGRELQIVTEKYQGDHISITVSDSGPLLKTESLDRFFEAFYSTKATGMGIGLSLCRSIIEAHEGRIWAGANVPHGATLHVRLPASRLR